MAGSINDLARYRLDRAIEELDNAKVMLEHADYEDFFVVSGQDAAKLLIQAETFLGYVQKYLEDKL